MFNDLMGFGKTRSQQLLTGICLVAIALVFHSYNLDYSSLSLDETFHVWHAQKPFSDVVEKAANDPNPPIFNVLTSVWVKQFGVAEWTLRFFSVLMGALSVLAMYVIGLRNFGFRVGVMAALLFCFSPMLFRFTHLIRPYTLLMITVILSYGFLFEYVRSPSKWKLFLYYLTTTLMIYVHPTSIFNLPAHVTIALLGNYNNLKRVGVILLTIVLAALSFGVYYITIPYFEKEVEMWFAPPNWEDMWYVMNVFYAKWYVMAIQSALVILLLIPSVRKRWSKHWIHFAMIATWIAFPLSISYIFSHLFEPVFQDKYVLSALPGMLLLLAISIDVIAPKYWKLIPFVPALLVSALWIDLTPHTEGDWRNVVAYINADKDQETAVFINPWYEFTSFSYYNDPVGFANTDSTMKRMVSDKILWAWHDVVSNESTQANYDRLYLVSAHSGYADLPFNLDSLHEHSDLISERKFDGVNVQLFQLNKHKIELEVSN
ncbi:MAG: glycosyltransferase family 39 protein [Flavobacteriales bacterium]|nr:glycosyltransferase family 39 protein [Flavobacteriales bacterium]